MDVILRKDKSIKFHVCSIFLGVLLTCIGVIVYLVLYKKNIGKISYDSIIYMSLCIETILFGIVLCLINFEKRVNTILLFVALGFLISSFLFNPPFRFGIILLLGMIILFLLTMRFKNVFSTLVTMTLSATLFIVLIGVIIKIVDARYSMVVLYCEFSTYIVSYRLFGKKVNQWFISKILGFVEESKTYDDNQLKNQILMFYMIIFVILNVYLYLGKIDDSMWNLINNSFLTGLAIIQIDWNKIIFYFTEKT